MSQHPTSIPGRAGASSSDDDARTRTDTDARNDRAEAGESQGRSQGRNREDAPHGRGHVPARKAKRRRKAQEHREGPVARTIEDQTAQLPSDTFLWTAGAAAATSLLFQVVGARKVSNFVGLWTPTILLLGLYNKIVKQQGHDQVS